MNKSKEVYCAFRAAAQELVATNGFPETADGARVHIEPNANVLIGEDGAFVEATIWVPWPIASRCA